MYLRKMYLFICLLSIMLQGFLYTCCVNVFLSLFCVEILFTTLIIKLNIIWQAGNSESFRN